MRIFVHIRFLILFTGFLLTASVGCNGSSCPLTSERPVEQSYQDMSKVILEELYSLNPFGNLPCEQRINAPATSVLSNGFITLHKQLQKYLLFVNASIPSQKVSLYNGLPLSYAKRRCNYFIHALMCMRC